MPDEVLLLVKRAEGCECAVFLSPTGPVLGREQDYPGHPYAFIPCKHGSAVEVLNARVVECEDCGGLGRVEMLPVHSGTKATRRCDDCDGTGLCLVPKDEPCGLPDGSVNYG